MSTERKSPGIRRLLAASGAALVISVTGSAAFANGCPAGRQPPTARARRRARPSPSA